MRKSRHECLAAGLERFFAENPDEELTMQDVAAKFGVSVATARAVIVKQIHMNGQPLELVQTVRKVVKEPA